MDDITFGNLNPPTADTIPDIFSFMAQTDVALNTTVTSNTITVSGIGAATAISISGGTYSVNGGIYKSTSSTVANGDTVTVKLTSSSSYSTAKTATLTIGGISGAFKATTIANDSIPDSFSFTSQTGIALNTLVTSNSITVSGIAVASAISITGGTYSVNGGVYTSASGTVANGDTVTVQLTSSGSYSTTTTSTLTIGGVSGIFSVSTIDDTTPDTFSFTASTGAATGTVITSGTITVSGINAATAISITGGTYSINGGAYTSEAGTVNNGDTVTVQVTSGDYSATTSAVLTVGGVSSTFAVTTISDTVPDAFSFTAQAGVALSTVATSNTITVSGIDAATAISVSGGAYSINGGAYTSDTGTVNNGDTVTVQMTSSESNSTMTSAILTIGDVSGIFSVTTKSDNSVTLTFEEGFADGEHIYNYYNGGYSYDYNGQNPVTGPGPNYGIIFKGSIYSHVNTSSPKTGIWRGEPTTPTAIHFQSSGPYINVPNGFTGSFSFYYGNPNGVSHLYL